jgi:hypothetical protein
MRKYYTSVCLNICIKNIKYQGNYTHISTGDSTYISAMHTYNKGMRWGLLDISVSIDL